jgi:tuftelin-interacting protein 11
MARYLRAKFKVDPQDQEPYLEMLTGVFEWLEIISASMVGEVVVAEVFPMWHDVLYQWLITDEANYEEIGQWFEWWKDEVFPDAIKSLPSITAEFEKGTALIEKALDLGDRAKTDLEPPQTGPALQAPKSPSREKSHHKRHHRREEPQPTPTKQEAPVATFKSKVEDWCQANDLQFIPERKKVHAEGPLYRITARGDGKGGVLVYFKGDRLFAETRKNGVVEIRADRESDLVVLMEYAQ